MMKKSTTTRRGQRGIAAVELALVLPVFLVLLTFPLFIGRMFWHYSAIQRAAQDAARYVSTIPLGEIRNSAQAPELAAIANEIIAAELADLAPGASPTSVLVTCDAGDCYGYTTPMLITIHIQMIVDDIFFSEITSFNFPITANIAAQYMGR